MKRPIFWLALGLLSIVSAVVAIRYFPRAFSIVALDITMDRERALEEARAIMGREAFGPSGYRQAASFALDDSAQRFVELEGGGKDTFTNMLREGLYSAYTWRVRHFKEGETNETTIRFTPDGQPYGFVEKLREDSPGASLDAAAARAVAESGVGRWQIDLRQYELVEQGQERRVAGRVDHTLTYERPRPTLNDGRYRLRLVVSGERLTEVTHLIRVPEAFNRRYESMRSANDAIGIGAAVGMALLYIFSGIGVGLFFMLRQRWVLWRHAAFWGAAVGFMQALSLWNELPLRWMTYDTAVARSTFLAEHTAMTVASFVGFSAFFALSFIAAETLTRRAFGHHPQLWHVWSKRSADGTTNGPGASTSILGRTVAGYLLVPIFLSYVVLFYYVAFNNFGWWSPSETLLNPDVLATYAPWLSAIANSFQAGFWEEALFRAVPLAGAALIGERLGQRRLFLVAAFAVQAIIFGAGHAPYPGQPAYARPVELILPSIGFGLLYLYFGLLPAVVLHFTFDVVLFALPIFVARAPGIWIQKLMVVTMALVPLWVVLWRRTQLGRWTELTPADRNATWLPPAVPERDAVEAPLHDAQLTARARRHWLAIGAASLIVCAGALVAVWRTSSHSLPIERRQAISLVRNSLEQRGVVLDRRWRLLPLPDNGAGSPHEFVSTTAGEERRRELLGRYLPASRWRVRVATFEGDVADRAEEWNAYVMPSGDVSGIQHVLPEGRAGATLDESSARELARKAVAERFGLDPTRDIREVSNKPTRLNARTDWTFTFVDTTIASLPQGEPRIRVVIAGDEVASTERFVFVPEHWERQQRAANTRNLILRILGTMVLAGVLVGAAVTAVIAWSRHRFTPRLFVAGTVLMLVISVAKSANTWTSVLGLLSTAAPLELQLAGVIGVGLVGLILSAALVGLSLGAVPQRLAGSSTVGSGDVVKLGMSAGLFGAAMFILAGSLRTPEWAALPNLTSAGAMLPVVQTAIDPLTRVLTSAAVILPALVLVGQITAAWRIRRVRGALVLMLLGFAASGVPAGNSTSGWLAAGSLMAAALVVVYATLLRFDLTIVPMALGTMFAVTSLADGAERAYPGAVAGSAIAAVLALLVGWWWSHALRRARARISAPSSADPQTV